MHHHSYGQDEPTPEDLAAIEREMPLIEAEIDLLDAEIRLITVGTPSPLDWWRLRRALARVAQEAARLADRPTERKAAA